MRKLPFLLIVIGVTLWTGCTSKDNFTLKGNLEGLTSDTLLVFFQHPTYRLDTLMANHGCFSYRFTPDTLTAFSIVLPNGEQIPIFANKGEEASLTGTPDNWEVKGKGENALLNHTRKHLTTVSASKSYTKEKLMHAVDSCILAHPYSFTNLYLIDHYYIKSKKTNTDHLKELIKGLSGQLKDTHFLSELVGQIDHWETPNQVTRLSHISYKDKDGRYISPSSLRGKYILVSFWASWNPESLAEQDSLAKVQKALKKDDFLIISISLDLDRKAWLQACEKRDTTHWRQVCDFTGWENALVKQQGIEQLPCNLFFGPDKQILARDLQGVGLTEKIKEFIQKDKEQEKAILKAKRSLKYTSRR